MKIKLRSYKLLFRLLDILSNSKWLHKLVVNKKVYLGASIISLSLANHSCTSDNNASEDKIPDKIDSITKKPASDSLIENKEIKKDSSIRLINNKHKIITSTYPKIIENPNIEFSGCYIIISPETEPVLEPETDAENYIYTVVEEDPQFIGGTDSLLQYISSNTKYFPSSCYVSIEGTVFVKFVVTKTGELTDIKVIKGLGNAQDEEAIRLVKNMPKWIPAIHQGKTVNTYFTLPIRFKLQ